MIDEVCIMNENNEFVCPSLEDGKMFKSFDDEYSYRIYEYSPNNLTMMVDILDKDLNSIASRKWNVNEFTKQLKNETILEY